MSSWRSELGAELDRNKNETNMMMRTRWATKLTRVFVIVYLNFSYQNSVGARSKRNREASASDKRLYLQEREQDGDRSCKG